MIVTLTDFGTSEYLGVMKGIIFSICSKANIVDLYNKVMPQNIKEGAWVLFKNYRFFPKKTIFLCVVDPDVGSLRNPLIIQTKNCYFVGPDNGLMYPAASDDKILNIFKINSEKNISSTFHGRDIFAPAAAKLESSIKPETIGEKIKKIHELEFHLKDREGEVVMIDSFGNIITNLKYTNKKHYEVMVHNTDLILAFHKIYAEAPEEKLFLIEGSSGTLEISVKHGSANKKLQLKTGDIITIK